jgi:hypothetical protein
MLRNTTAPAEAYMGRIIFFAYDQDCDVWSHGLWLAPEGMSEAEAHALLNDSFRQIVLSNEEWNYDDVIDAIKAKGFDCIQPAFWLEEQAQPCECEKPGHFNSGVPGILAHIEDGRVMTRVERCDLCERFESDEAAAQYLEERHG